LIRQSAGGWFGDQIMRSFMEASDGRKPGGLLLIGALE